MPGNKCPDNVYSWYSPNYGDNGLTVCCCSSSCCFDECKTLSGTPPQACLEKVPGTWGPGGAEWRFDIDKGYHEAWLLKDGKVKIPFCNLFAP